MIFRWSCKRCGASGGDLLSSHKRYDAGELRRLAGVKHIQDGGACDLATGTGQLLHGDVEISGVIL